MFSLATVLGGLGLPSCLLRVRELFLPGKLPIVPRVLARAEQCLQVPRLSRGQMSACVTRQFPEPGVPVTHRSPARGCRGNAPQLRASPSLCCFIFPWLCAVSASQGRQQGSPHPFPADSLTPGGCPVALPGLRLAGSDSRGKLCLSAEGAKELPSGGVSSEVTSPGLFPSGQQPAGESVVCASTLDVLTHQPGAFAPRPSLTELLQLLCPLASPLCHPWDCVHGTVRSFECLPIQSFTLSPGKVGSAVVPWEQSTSLLLCQHWDHLLPALLRASRPGATAQVRTERPAWKLSRWSPPDPWLEQSGSLNQRNLVSFETCWLGLF